MRPTRVLLAAGLLVWALSGVSIARGPMGSAVGVAQVTAWLVFGGAFLSEFFRPAMPSGPCCWSSLPVRARAHLTVGSIDLEPLLT